MALAKFLEDNQERLYASLEESRRQVNAIDEESSKKDWRFIKDRLTKELQLVQEQFDTVLKIVTNPDFENYVRDYEEKQSLEGQINYAYSQIKKMLVARKNLDKELIIVKEENTKLKKTIDTQASQIKKNQKEIGEINESLLASKAKLANAKNDLNHYKTVFYNRMVEYESLLAELTHTKERLETTERLLKPNPNYIQIIEEKQSLIRRLTNELVQLDEWCGMLEAELEISGERPIEISIEQAPTSSKSRSVKFSSYKKLSLELAKKSIRLNEKRALIHDQKSNINKLEEIVKRGQSHIAVLEDNINKLKTKLNNCKKSSSNTPVKGRITKKDISGQKNKKNNKLNRKVTNKFNKTKAIKAERVSHNLDQSSSSSIRKSSEEQYHEYIAKIRKKRK